MPSFLARALGAAAAISVAGAAALVTGPAVAAPTDTSVTFTDAAAIQSWTVPADVTMIYVDLRGAQGGAANNRGAGARLTGALSVTPGQTLNIIAGTQGQNGVAFTRGGGGGGGSFIYTTADEDGILAAAGGGGGAGSNRGGLSASITTSGKEGGNGGGAGGVDGGGGVEGSAGGGGGLLGDGVGGNRGGASLANGAAGGPGANVTFVGMRGTGGFGGGGGTGSTGGGGGGGYSGGGGGQFAGGNGGGGAGGGSFFDGSLTGAVSNHHGRGNLTIFYSSYLTSISPATAPVGASVTIDGSGLAGATVTIGGVAATVTSSTDTQLVVTVPDVGSLPADGQTVEVATAGGVTLPAVEAFTYVEAATVSGVSPSSIPRGSGETVTITGTLFTGATAVSFSDTPATSFTIESDTTITATVPASLPAGIVHTTVMLAGVSSVPSSADELVVEPYPAMTVSPATLPEATVGEDYSSQLTASGGTAPYTYSVADGALPAGIALDAASGALAGTPTDEGTSTLTIQVADLYDNAATGDYSVVTVAAAPAVPAATGDVLPDTGPELWVPLAMAGGLLLSGLAAAGFALAGRRRLANP